MAKKKSTSKKKSTVPKKSGLSKKARKSLTAKTPVQKVLLAGMAVLIIAALSLFLPSEGAEMGDTVTFSYSLQTADGGLSESGNLTLTLGGGRLILGVESALLGMSVGDTSSITVLPKDGYGEKNLSLVAKQFRYINLPLTTEADRSYIEEVLGDTPLGYGVEVELPGTHWKTTVGSISGDTVNITHYLVNGSLYYIFNYPYSLKVIDVTDDGYIVENLAKVGGPIQIQGRLGYIESVDDTFIYTDFNHPMAGKTLLFDLELLDIQRASEEEE
ncbi:TPA: FKBP-type peptidyl-prolyl cis-trans isomerase [archaeon]|uniref:Peptidyl-prolyl cis-trans isomerase n=1 Tax=Candidatus Undinarchaeum marinum TaxID=2756141 RepID=A0A832ULU8_9ARCH|nr:FKBP-type peptidyl-prolyl cis-trans isomerase [Candidatus Undinarchaeum marinum]